MVLGERSFTCSREVAQRIGAKKDPYGPPVGEKSGVIKKCKGSVTESVA